MDKSWMSKGRLTREFAVGLESFLEFAKKNVVDQNYIPCICARYGSVKRGNADTIRAHVYVNGIDLTYERFIWHGEKSTFEDLRNENDVVGEGHSRCLIRRRDGEERNFLYGKLSRRDARRDASLAAVAMRLTTSINSQLMASQVNRTYEARKEKMIKYLTSMKELMSRFKKSMVTYIPHKENVKVGQLGHLASLMVAISSRAITLLVSSESELRKSEVEVLNTMQQAPTWNDIIIQYLERRVIPDSLYDS
ncbi:hypothetical protein DH2020_018944 [Rehmannia glutinosa]|uniref:Transposase-associated domain-containing protein n=1 Tax=Rehmannia glutinosa TaxID=99300 RepID=A0ABR0WNX4_REHGL